MLGVAGVLTLTSTGRLAVRFVQHLVETDDLGDNPLETADDLVRYLEAHPDRYSLAAWNVGDEDGGLFHDADALVPLASTVKLIPLVLASGALADGGWQADEPIDVEPFYLPGTDGDAHRRASAVDGGTRTVAGAVHGMIRFSDNAATDALLLKLGREALTSFAPGLPSPHPLMGTHLLAVEGFMPDGGTSLDDAAWAKTLAAQRAKPGELPTLDIAAQEAMARNLDNRGSPRAFARLVEKVFTQDEVAMAVARRELQWPMVFPANQRDFVAFGTKGGSLPGVLTSTSWAETKSGQRRVVALFLHDLSLHAWLNLVGNFKQQELEHQLLFDPDALERLRPRLGR